MTPENPLRSKRFLAYALTLVVLVVAIVLKDTCTVQLAEAIIVGLGVFMGGESAVRGVRDWRAGKTAAVAPEPQPVENPGP